LKQQLEEVHANTEMMKGQRNKTVDIMENDIMLLIFSNIIQQNINDAIELEDPRNYIEEDILEKQQQ
jgi:hypothetical protein